MCNISDQDRFSFSLRSQPQGKRIAAEERYIANTDDPKKRDEEEEVKMSYRCDKCNQTTRRGQKLLKRIVYRTVLHEEGVHGQQIANEIKPNGLIHIPMRLTRAVGKGLWRTLSSRPTERRSRCGGCLEPRRLGTSIRARPV